MFFFVIIMVIVSLLISLLGNFILPWLKISISAIFKFSEILPRLFCKCFNTSIHFLIFTVVDTLSNIERRS